VVTARALIKETACGLAHAVGLPGVGRRARRDGLTILTYHSFGPAAEHPYLPRMPTSRFAEQIAHLRRHFEIVAIEEGLDRLGRMHGSLQQARPMVALTVDDGYGDGHAHFFPVISAAGVPITVFLATDYLDSGRLPWPTQVSALLHFATATSISKPVAMRIATGAERDAAGRALRQILSRLPHAERDAAVAGLAEELAPRRFAPVPPLTWDQVRQMAAADVRFGAHTHYHGWLDRLGADEVADELARSRQRIEAEVGEPCRLLAYPNGNWNETVVEAARRAGFTIALTQDTGVNRRDGLRPLALKRIEVPYNERIGTFACRITGTLL
jgi:peptidoglycan/xylan/chitin deacetylase (PgdA/CDA1 family)